MSNEVSGKMQIVLWWITSIAASVICCSVLFVLFASYLVDVREAVRDSNMRINLMETREDRILSELDIIKKHMIYSSAAQMDAQVKAGGAPQAQTPEQPANEPAAPATAAPAAPETPAAAPTAPTVKK